MERIVLSNQEQKEMSRPVIGMAAVIINASTGEIWSVEEQVSKALTGRQAGQLSIPLETRKIGESIMSNLEGAMAEASSDKDSVGNDVREQVIGNLFHFNTIPQGVVIVPVGSRMIRCDLSVLLYGGMDTLPQPYSTEVINARWIDPVKLLEGNVRPLARDVVNYTLDSGLYVKSLSHFRQEPWRAQKTFSPNFSIISNHTRRELLPDCS